MELLGKEKGVTLVVRHVVAKMNDVDYCVSLSRPFSEKQEVGLIISQFSANSSGGCDAVLFHWPSTGSKSCTGTATGMHCITNCTAQVHDYVCERDLHFVARLEAGDRRERLETGNSSLRPTVSSLVQCSMFRNLRSTNIIPWIMVCWIVFGGLCMGFPKLSTPAVAALSFGILVASDFIVFVHGRWKQSREEKQPKAVKGTP